MHLKPAATIRPNNGAAAQKGTSMARRRYQSGCLILRGGVYYGQWREDFLNAQGKSERKLVCKPLGTTMDFPTKKLALRALRDKVSPVNSLDYRPKVAATFNDFWLKYEDLILPTLRKASRQAITSRVTVHILPFFGETPISEIDGLLMQQFVNGIKLNGKTVRNIVADMRSMWNYAEEWSYASHNPFRRLALPAWEQKEQPCLTLEQMRRIAMESDEPYKTMYWVLAETGMRGGELVALRKPSILFDERGIEIRSASSSGEAGRPKNKKVRHYPISNRLIEHLKVWGAAIEPDGLLFPRKDGGMRWVDVVVSDNLVPLLTRLGIPRCGTHAFRHGNATLLDHINAPDKVRLNRLGHYDKRMSMAYTHTSSEDERAVAEQLGELLQ